MPTGPAGARTDFRSARFARAPGYLTARNNVLVVTTDVPPDVEAVLTQLFEESREAFERGDRETGVATVTSAATVARTKLPECTLRAHVLHGCERAEAVTTAEDDDTAVAAEYVAAMERRLADATAE